MFQTQRGRKKREKEREKTHLGKRQMHKRQVIHDRLPNAHHHQNAASPNHKRRGTDAALNPGALQGHPRLRILPVAKQSPHPSRVFLPVEPRVDAVSDARRDQLLGKGESPRLNVRDDDGMRPGRPRGGEREKAYGACAADEDRRSQRNVRGLDCVQDYAEGLQECALSVRNGVRQPKWPRQLE